MQGLRFIALLLFPLLLSACGPRAEVTAATPSLAPAGEAVLRERRPDLTEGYAAFRKAQIEDVAYSLALDLDETQDSFAGEVEIRFTMRPGNLSPLTIDFDSGEILDLRVNGEPADYEYERWFLSLAPETFTTGTNVVGIRYRRPYATDGAGLHRFTDPENGEVYLYTNFEPYAANRLLPHFDQPNLKAPLTLRVLAPASWQVIGNTRETAVSAQADGRRLWEFPASAPISSYVYAMHAGPFEVWEDDADGIPLRLFARSAIAPYVETEEWFAPTRQSFAFFQDYFDIPYPFGKYDQVIVPDFNAGAMENVGAVTFNERYVTRGEKSTAQRLSLAYVIAHEMAHMWFGDLVTMDWWNGLWLNESFATYMAYLELERASDFENVWDNYYSGNKQSAYTADQLVTTHPIELEVPATSDAFTNFDGITYGKGGSVLKQLPYFLGEENFRAGVSNYLKKHAYGNTTLADFVGELGLAAGMDLGQWQREWLYRSGVNTVEADFSCEDGRLRSLRLIQRLPATEGADQVLRTQRTQVALYRYTDGRMVAGAVLPLTYSGPVTPVTQAIGQPCPDLVFPNEGDWAYMKIQLDEMSMATLRERINDFEEPGTRIMLWQSLWDSVRDAALPLTDYVDFALANLGPERDQNIARLVSGHLGSAFSFMSSLQGRHPELAEGKARIEAFLLERLEAAEPGSDLQKLWFDALAGRAHTAEGLAYLRTLLAGERSLPGLEIDQDKRWSIVLTLNRHLDGDHQAVLEAERARDPSDQGNNMALAAEAVRPQRDVKARWLDVVIDNPDSYKLATLRAVLPWLFPPEQGELLESFAARLLDPVPRISAEGDEGYMDEYVGNLAPATCTEESVARLREANARFAGLHPLVTKSYRIWQQEDQRCVDIGALLE